MLKIIIILVLFYSLQQSYQVDLNNSALLAQINPSLTENIELASKKLPRGAKPCTRRNSNSNPIDNPDEWLPTYSTRVVIPSVDVRNINVDTQRNDNNQIKMSTSEDVLLVQKKPRKESLINPQDNLKTSQNLLLNNQDGPLSSKRQESEDDNKLNVLKKELHVADPESTEYRKPNRNLLVSESIDRDVLVDNDYLSRPIHESEDQLPQISQSLYTNNIANEPKNTEVNSFIVDSKQKGNSDNKIENENCDENDSLTDTAQRRFLPNNDELDDDNDEILRNGKDHININDPAKGVGIKELAVSKMSLLQHSRVCYACSTVNNPTCWLPDRRTTVKYCRRGHEACVTKTFVTAQNALILTRDCGSSCDDADVHVPTYKSCSVCHEDMCNDTPNGATSVNKQNVIVCMLIMFVTKFTF